MEDPTEPTLRRSTAPPPPDTLHFDALDKPRRRGMRPFVIIGVLLFGALLLALVVRSMGVPASRLGADKVAQGTAVASVNDLAGARPSATAQPKTTVVLVVMPTLGPVATATADATLTPAPGFTPAVQLTATPVVQPGRPLSLTGVIAQPFVGPGYRADDGKPVFVCAVASFGSYLTAVQIQAAGIDEANGFHLAIVPYELNPDYSIAQSDTESNMRSGAWDCELSTIDSIARSGYGVVTAVIDESAGGDGMYARNMSSIYDLRGKRITYEAGTSAEYFVHYALFIAQISPRDVVLVPKDGANEAVKAFNDRQADVISLYDPYLAETVVSGGKPLVLSDQLRVVLDVLAISHPALANKNKAVQAFHNAWFDALKLQTEDYDSAAAQIAAWGMNDWSGVSVANAGDDLKGAMKVIAQTGLDANVALFKSPETLLSAMRTARDVWRTQHTVSDEPLETLIDGSFVNEAARSGVRLPDAKPLNNSFSLVALTGDAANGEYTLPCQQYAFTPNSIKLTVESRHVLDLCVLPVLQQRPSVRLRITGSAAWPGPKGAFDEATVRAYARQRADAVAAYLVEKGITRDRLTITEILPPAERRGINNEVEQTKDRFVRMELLFGGF